MSDSNKNELQKPILFEFLVSNAFHLRVVADMESVNFTKEHIPAIKEWLDHCAAKLNAAETRHYLTKLPDRNSDN